MNCHIPNGPLTDSRPVATAASLGTLPDGTAIELVLADLLAPHSFIMGGTGAGKSSAIARICEIASEQGVPLLMLDPEGQFGALRHSCPGTIVIGSEGDIPLDVDRIEYVVEEGLRNRASLVLQLDELADPLQRKTVAKVLNALRTLPNEYWHHRLVIIDEVHIFAPQRGVCESSLPLAEVAARGRRRGVKLVCATQRFARVSKDLVSQCGNILVGKVNAATDRDAAIDTLGPRREDGARLQLLQRGCFIAMGPDFCPEPVELRILKPRTVLGNTLEIDSGHARPVLTGEALLEAMRAAHAGNAVGLSVAGGSSMSRANVGEGEGPLSVSNASAVQPGTMELCLALISAAPGKALPAIALPLLLRTDTTKRAVEQAIRQARRKRLITGCKKLAITASGDAALASASLGPNLLAERVGIIRIGITRQMKPILDIITSSDRWLSFAEIASISGYPETSRKLRRLLEQLGRAGLVHRRRGLFAPSPAYVALVAL